MHVDQSLSPSARHLRHAPGMEPLVPLVPPACPEPVVAILRAGVVSSKMTFPEGDGYRRVERWEPPQSVGQEEMALAQHYLRELTAYLAPAIRGEVLARILALLSHYRLELHSPQVEAWIADDWAEDLEGYPMWAVNRAARIWRRTMRFKPQTGEIVKICEQSVASLRQDRERLRLLFDRPAQAGSQFTARKEKLAAGMLKRMP